MALTIKARIRGSKALQRELKKRGREAPKAMAKALFQEAERIMGKSKRIVPVDKGPLRASGHVQLPEIRGKKVSVTLGYGGAAAPYAVIVHEKPARHNAPTQWKYLEVPLNEAIPGMAGRIARSLRRDVA
jgi:hypothetical protein